MSSSGLHAATSVPSSVRTGVAKRPTGLAQEDVVERGFGQAHRPDTDPLAGRAAGAAGAAPRCRPRRRAEAGRRTRAISRT